MQLHCIAGRLAHEKKRKSFLKLYNTERLRLFSKLECHLAKLSWMKGYLTGMTCA